MNILRIDDALFPANFNLTQVFRQVLVCLVLWFVFMCVCTCVAVFSCNQPLLSESSAAHRVFILLWEQVVCHFG